MTTEAAVGIDLNVFDINGKTPLMLAVLVSGTAPSRAEVCGLLLKEGALSKAKQRRPHHETMNHNHNHWHHGTIAPRAHRNNVYFFKNAPK